MSAIRTKPLRKRLCKSPRKNELCPICEDIPYQDPRQSACGHRFCEPCIAKLLGNNSNQSICPVDKLPLVPIFPDVFYRRDIKNSECHCAFTTRGCSWKGILADLEEHEEGCGYTETTCQECGASINRVDLRLHQERECAHRLVPCRYCSQPVKVDKVGDHDSQCQEIPMDCPQNCGVQNLTRRSLDDHLLTYCSKVTHACQFEEYGCEFRGNWTEQEKHRSENLDLHMVLLLRNDKQRQATVSRLVQENERLASELKELTQKLEIASSEREKTDAALKESDGKLAEALNQKERTDALASQLEEVIETIRLQGNSTRQLEKGLSSLTPLDTCETRNMRGSLCDIERRLWLLENSSFTGNYLWKVEHFSRHLREAKEGKRTSLVSAPFYVGRFGYKACIILYPNGQGSGRGTHVGIVLSIMKGNHDQVLSWPFHFPVELRLLGKRGIAMKKTFTPCRELACFERPTTGMNPGYGYLEFCPLSLLKKDYIHEDTVFILVNVKGATEQSPSFL